MIDMKWGTPLIYEDTDMRGDWWGFVSVLRLMISAYPESGWFVVVQDDAVACETPDALMELSCFSYANLTSLFTTSTEPERWATKTLLSGKQLAMDLTSAKSRANSCNGGIAYLVPGRIAKNIISTAHTSWTPTPQKLGQLCARHQEEYRLTTRNLFEHIGERSSLQPPDYKWNVTKAEPYRKKG